MPSPLPPGRRKHFLAATNVAPGAGKLIFQAFSTLAGFERSVQGDGSTGYKEEEKEGAQF
jgi:hypothetical protein